MAKYTLLDGGLGHLLKTKGVTLPDVPFDQQFLAGAVANQNSPDTIQQIHEEYIRAGSDVITTNSFICTPYNLSKIGRADDATTFIKAAGRIAQAAKQHCGWSGLIAGSLPPLKESYQAGDLGTDEEILGTYRLLSRPLAPFVDVLLLETLSTVQEVRCAARAAAEVAGAQGKPVWVSVSLEDSTRSVLRSGEKLQEAVAAACGQLGSNLKAFLVNCCAPAAVTSALPVLKESLPAGAQFGGYANGFQTTTTQWLTGQPSCLPTLQGDFDSDGVITPAAYMKHVQQWIDLGATIVGGCCGIGPQHITVLRQELDKRLQPNQDG